MFLIPFCSNGQQGLSYPYYLKSENDKYFLKSIPHASQMYHVAGRTDVFNSTDSSILYSIDRYFDPKGIILSNDGYSIFYARYSIYNYDDFDEDILLFYKNGELLKKYSVEQLVKKNIDDYSYPLFYSNHEIYDWENGEMVLNDSVKTYFRKIIIDPFYSHDNIVFMATRDKELLQFDFVSGDFILKTKLDESEELINKNHSIPKYIEPVFECPGAYGIPKLSDGREYEIEFAEKFNYSYDGIVEKDEFKYFRLELHCLIDHSGKCLEAYSNFEDSTLNQEIEDYFLTLKFDPLCVPEIVEKWYFFDHSSYRNKNINIAKQERLIEKKEEQVQRLFRIQQDTLGGIYIPKDLEDCFRELDKILTENNRREFKNSDPIECHFGLGKNLRNRWGLWSGSRLQNYFENLGISHPDDMSGIILDSYHAYLNDKPINLDKQLKKYQLIPAPQLVIPDYLKKDKKNDIDK